MGAADPTDAFVEIDGLTFHYLDWGGTAKRQLLLLHGLTSNAHAWSPFVRDGYLSLQEFRIIALDQRGHGDSDHSRDYSVRTFANDIDAFAKKMGFADFDLIGHSMGARHAMAYGGDHWQDLHRLVIVDFGPEMARSGAIEVKGRVSVRPAGFSSIEKAVDYMREVTPDRADAELRHNAEHALRLNYAGKYVWKHDSELQWISGGFGVKEQPYLWEQAAKIACPSLIVRGETSNVLDREITDRMLAVMPTTRAVVIAGASHTVPQDRPQEFWREVLAFLRE